MHHFLILRDILSSFGIKKQIEDSLVKLRNSKYFSKKKNTYHEVSQSTNVFYPTLIIEPQKKTNRFHMFFRGSS